MTINRFRSRQISEAQERAYLKKQYPDRGPKSKSKRRQVFLSGAGISNSMGLTEEAMGEDGGFMAAHDLAQVDRGPKSARWYGKNSLKNQN
jgi:hypothetical protein